MKSLASELGLSRVKLRLKTTTLAHNKQRVTTYKTSDSSSFSDERNSD